MIWRQLPCDTWTVHEASEFEKCGKITTQWRAQSFRHLLFLLSGAQKCPFVDQNQKKCMYVISDCDRSVKRQEHLHLYGSWGHWVCSVWGRKSWREWEKTGSDPFSGVHGESTNDNVHKLQGKKSQLDLDTGRKLFMVRTAEHGASGLEKLWNQWFAAVQKSLGPAELSSLT